MVCEGKKNIVVSTCVESSSYTLQRAKNVWTLLTDILFTSVRVLYSAPERHSTPGYRICQALTGRIASPWL